MTIEVKMEDNLQEILDSISSSIQSELENFLEENPDWVNFEDVQNPEVPDFHGDLDYSGAMHEIIDNSVPTHTKTLKDLWYLYGEDFEEAFDNAGIGNKEDKDWPMGWKAAAIYSYLEQKAYGWYEDNAPEIVENYTTKKKKEWIQKELNKIKVEEDEDEEKYY